MGSETQSCRERRSGRTLTTGASLARLASLALSLSLSLSLLLSLFLLLLLFSSLFLSLSLSLALSLALSFSFSVSGFSAPSVFPTHPPPHPFLLPPSPRNPISILGLSPGGCLFWIVGAGVARWPVTGSVHRTLFLPPVPQQPLPSFQLSRPPSNSLLNLPDERGARQLTRELRDPSSKWRLRL